MSVPPDLLLLFVCTGNICRSPFAEAWARRRLAEVGHPGRVASAGIRALVGEGPPREARAAAEVMGAPVADHRGQQLDEALCRSARHVLVMEPFQAEVVEDELDFAGAALLSRFAPGPVAPAAIPDPYRAPPWAYAACFSLIAACVDGLLKEIGAL